MTSALRTEATIWCLCPKSSFVFDCNVIRLYSLDEKWKLPFLKYIIEKYFSNIVSQCLYPELCVIISQLIDREAEAQEGEWSSQGHGERGQRHSSQPARSGRLHPYTRHLAWFQLSTQFVSGGQGGMSVHSLWSETVSASSYRNKFKEETTNNSKSR